MLSKPERVTKISPIGKSDFPSYSFDFQQHDQLITAYFSGGSILSGKLIGVLEKGNVVAFRYTYLTIKNELKGGNCTFSLMVHEKIQQNYWETTKDNEGKNEVTTDIIQLLKMYL